MRVLVAPLVSRVALPARVKVVRLELDFLFGLTPDVFGTEA
jgi:hypothetical protein